MRLAWGRVIKQADRLRQADTQQWPGAGGTWGQSDTHGWGWGGGGGRGHTVSQVQGAQNTQCNLYVGGGGVALNVTTI